MLNQVKRKSVFLVTLALSVALLGGCGQQAEGPGGDVSDAGQNPGTSQFEPPVLEGGVFDSPEQAEGPADEEIAYYLPADDLPPYQILAITESRYEGPHAYITFAQLPQTDAETLVCDEYYSWVVEQGGALAALWLPGPSAPLPLSNERSSLMSALPWIQVGAVTELSLAEILPVGQQDTPLFAIWHERYGGGLSYEEYVTAVTQAGCRVVRAEYETLYTEEARLMGPQLDDGERLEYWLLVPDEEGRLRLFDNTKFSGQFAPPYFEAFNPAALVL